MRVQREEDRRAISFGRLHGSAPSTQRDHPIGEARARILRHHLDLEPIGGTQVPPVTALRSPPASRTTGALSPVIALSSTEGDPSMISPSAGMRLVHRDGTTSPRRALGRRHRITPSPRRWLESSGFVASAFRMRTAVVVIAHLPQRRRLRLARALRPWPRGNQRKHTVRPRSQAVRLNLELHVDRLARAKVGYTKEGR
jgi:hypothetical protein